MDVGGWLRGLGLGQYEEQFRDNKIDADLLPRLTVDDLKDIGVSVVGDRRRLLDAIAVIAGAGPPADVPASPTKTAPSKGLQASAERRPITVMFCDLVGSTSLAARLDAEDWRNLVNAYLDEASAAVTGFGGHVLKKLGDGLMALFGYPQAQENDAERAVRAALAIQRALVELNAKNAGKGAPELSARIGLETGPVVVEASGEVFGDAPNIAARVQAAAEPGSVLITMNVQRQVAGLFVAEEKGARELRGVGEPIELFHIVRASGGRRRAGARTLTPFVGREEELGMLARWWDRAKGGDGQVVLVVGEPGLGKSRLIEEFHSQLAETPHTWVEWSASQLLQNTPLHPIAEWGRQRFGVDAPAEQRLADLKSTLRLVGLDPAEHAPLLAPLVDIPLPPERAAGFPPDELRRRQLAAMTAWYVAGARSQPAVLVFEDLHWADPTSLDLLGALADRGAQAPLLLLATTRPEFRPPWNLRSHHSLISLSPLDRAGVARMVGEISASHALSKEVIEGVSERTGGVPLFVEEVTRLLLERGERGGVQAIPPTLQQSLAARLDRLGSAREVAQIGAVLGRDFAYRLLRDVTELDEPALQELLERLADADLLFVEGAPPVANYRFKHALIQDAAYDSLLKSRRQTLHRRAAEVLRDDSERAAAEPELIAHHFTQAGLDDLAIEWWGKAGDQALRRSAFQESIAHLGKAIEMADKAAGSTSLLEAGARASSSQRLRLQTDYGQAMTLLRGFASEESKAAFTRARELATGTENAAERFATYYGQWIGCIIRGEAQMSCDMAAAFLREAEDEGRLMEIAAARRCVGLSCFAMGDFAQARRFFDQALTDSGAESDADASFRLIHDTEAAAKMNLALVMWHLGEIGRARQLTDEALRRTAELRHAPTTASVNVYRGLLETARGDHQATLKAAEVLVRLGKEHGMELYLAVGELFSSWARGWLIDPKIGVIEYRNALKNYMDRGNKYFAPFNKGLLAELIARNGDLQSALMSVEEGLTLAQETKQHWSDVFLYRLRGEVLLKQDARKAASAADALRTAVSTARQQSARSFGLQAALSLAKLYQSTGRLAEAHAVLTPAFEGFSPTSEMPEIAEAQALLAALAETEEVKAAEAQRQRRLHLQASYGHAMMWSKGFAAEDTKAAFAREAELAGETRDLSARFAAYLPQARAALTEGELRAARELALTFLPEAEQAGQIREAAFAHNVLGCVAYWQGEFAEARSRCETAIAALGTSGDLIDWGVLSIISTSFLALTMWQLGEVERARELIDVATKRADEMGGVPEILDALFYKSYLDLWRGDPLATLRAAEALEHVAREHGTMQYLNEAELHSGWARGQIDNPVAGAAQIQRVLAAFVEQGVKVNLGFYTGLLAQLEAETLGAERALGRIDEAFRLSEQVEHGCSLPFLHRLRGEILRKRDPSDPAAAEEAFRTSIAIAKGQGARSPVLLASLALAKLLQSTGRCVEAHAVLALALEGFSPTPEMPEIAEAQALLARLAHEGGSAIISKGQSAES